MVVETKRTEISFNSASLMVSLLLLAPFLCICLYFVVNPGMAGLAAMLIRLASAVFFVLFLFAGRSVLRQMNSSEPAMVIDSAGITDNTSELGHGLIKWEEILDISHHENNGLKHISIHMLEPVDHNHSKANKTLLKYTRKAANLADKHVININTQNLSMKSVALFNQIDEYYQQYKKVS